MSLNEDLRNFVIDFRILCSKEDLGSGVFFHIVIIVFIIVACNVNTPMQIVNEQHCNDRCDDCKQRIAYLVDLYKECADAADSCTETYCDEYAKIDERNSALKYNIQP